MCEGKWRGGGRRGGWWCRPRRRLVGMLEVEEYRW